MIPLTFVSDDLGETEEFLTRAYTPMHISGSPERTRAQISRAAMESVSIDQVAFDYQMTYDANALGKICLCSVHSGTIENHTEGLDGVLGPGEVAVLAKPDRPYQGRVCRADYNITMFDPALLNRVGASAPGRPHDLPIRLTGHRPVSAEAGRHLLQTIVFVRDQVLAEPVVSAAPLVAATTGLLLAASVLHAFPNTALTEPTSTDRHDAHHATLRAAVAYIDDHADSDISLADIAEAAHVSPRAVQYAFARHLETTPMAYLRQARLARAHRELLATDPGAATVTSVAAKWGFLHPSHFSALYRRTYGQPPSTTLRS